MSKQSEIANLEYYKAGSEAYNNLVKKIVRILPSVVLKNELKRRKLISFNWLTNKFEEIETFK